MALPASMRACPSHTTASLTLTPYFQCWRCTSKILFHRRNTWTWSMENQAESSLLGFYLHHFHMLDNSCCQCSSVQDPIWVREKAHMCSTLSHRSFPSVDHPVSQKFPQCWPPCLSEVSPVLTTLSLRSFPSVDHPVSQKFPQCWPPCLSEVSPVLTTLSLRSVPSVAFGTVSMLVWQTVKHVLRRLVPLRGRGLLRSGGEAGGWGGWGGWGDYKQGFGCGKRSVCSFCF